MKTIKIHITNLGRRRWLRFRARLLMEEVSADHWARGELRALLATPLGEIAPVTPPRDPRRRPVCVLPVRVDPRDWQRAYYRWTIMGVSAAVWWRCRVWEYAEADLDALERARQVPAAAVPVATLEVGRDQFATT
jgi:hypothetical protein